MSTSLAKNRKLLEHRVARLLASRGGEIEAGVLPFLTCLGRPALVGGAIRDLARGGRKAFSSDLDFVILSGSHHRFAEQMSAAKAVANKFGGYRLQLLHWQVDVWHIHDTWARTNGHRSVEQPEDLLECTFFDWDSVLFDVMRRRVIMHDDYLDRMHSNVLDIRLEANPNPRGALIRALRRAALWNVRFGPRLSEFARRQMSSAQWADLVRVDSRAFKNPVLRSLQSVDVQRALHIPDADGVTAPVSGWSLQVPLRFE